MPQLPEINWQQIRGKAPTGSRQDGFEELGSQLMMAGGLVTWPAGSDLTRLGNPDGGREGRGKLPSGEVWAWQTKYLFRLGDAEWRQIDKSVRRTLQQEPVLARYYVILPYDRPGGDTERTASAWTKWNTHVAAWEAAASEAGMTVEFVYLGAAELNVCLLQPSQAGRLRYWFDLEVFTQERFRGIAAAAAADAGGRYSPKLNVELPIGAAFEGLARRPSFEVAVRTRRAALRRGRGTFGLSKPDERPDLFEPALSALDVALKDLDGQLGEAAQVAGRATGTLPDLSSTVFPTQGALRGVAELLREHCLTDDRLYINSAGSLHSQVSALRAALGELNSFMEGRSWRAFEAAAVLITGPGGAGKTHLLCDLAEARVANGLPTIIVLGEQFETGPIEADLGRIIGFRNPEGALLATFEAACQAAEQVGLILIDGLNEPNDRSLWNRYLQSFLNDAAQHQHIRVVLTCRTEFLTETLSDTLQYRLPAFPHSGFEEVPQEAVRTFLDWYKIERPSFPMLDPELTNPLFLKLLCTALETNGETRFPREGLGASWIYGSFLEAMDTRLSSEDRCDYAPGAGLVQRAVEQVAAAMRGRGRRLPWDEVDHITSSLLPERTWSRSLLNGLLKEAVFSELSVKGQRYIRFGYERLGDIAGARLIIADGIDGLKSEIQTLAERWHSNAGILQALATLLPEHHGVELVDLLEISVDDYSAYGDFLVSVSWRRPDAVSDRTKELVQGLRAHRYYADDANSALLHVATVPGHSLNAEWLHGQLIDLTMPERDTAWSNFCDQQQESNGPLHALIEWAWSDAGYHSDDHTRRLASLALCWALCSTHRPTRDNATKALIALLERAPHLYGPILNRFIDVNDDYVEERLLSVGCGITQRIRPERRRERCNGRRGIHPRARLLAGELPEPRLCPSGDRRSSEGRLGARHRRRRCTHPTALRITVDFAKAEQTGSAGAYRPAGLPIQRCAPSGYVRLRRLPQARSRIPSLDLQTGQRPQRGPAGADPLRTGTHPRLDPGTLRTYRPKHLTHALRTRERA
ncbi:ATP-binding protein [Pilimelia columellifera]|uniref:NACHT domain-containing protein n=1 Tax=Pilimelia columellifera TaxID=706574 RepID=UPI0031E35071